MVRTINTEVAVLILTGFFLTVAGMYLNFQNLANAHDKFIDPNIVYNNEIVYGMLQIVGMLILFLGASRAIIRRSDIMTNKFINIVDVFAALIKKEMEMIDSKKSKQDMEKAEEKAHKFKHDLKKLRWV